MSDSKSHTLALIAGTVAGALALSVFAVSEISLFAAAIIVSFGLVQTALDIQDGKVFSPSAKAFFNFGAVVLFGSFGLAGGTMLRVYAAEVFRSVSSGNIIRPVAANLAGFFVVAVLFCLWSMRETRRNTDDKKS